jgi:hypothetical protein
LSSDNRVKVHYLFVVALVHVIVFFFSSAGATVHDELRPLLLLLAVGPDPVNFVSNFSGPFSPDFQLNPAT